MSPGSNQTRKEFASRTCADIKAFAMLAIGTESLLGGDSAAEIFVKMSTRLLPIFFAIGRVKQVIVIRAIERERQRIKQGRESGNRNRSLNRGNAGRIGRRDRAPSFFSKKPRLKDMEKKGIKIPKSFAIISLATTLSLCLAVFIRGEQVACPKDHPFWSANCAVQSFPVFSTSNVECPCHTLLVQPGHVYPGCASTNGTLFFRSVLDSQQVVPYINTLMIPGGCPLDSRMMEQITGKMTNLRVLLVDSPNITHASDSGDEREVPDSLLSPSLGDLSRLRALALNGLNIHTLPTSIGKLTALHELFLRHNPLPRVPDSFCAMEALRFLDLIGTEIEHEELGQFGCMRELTNLKASWPCELAKPSTGSSSSGHLDSRIADLQQLRALELGCFGLSGDLTPLASLTALTRLSLSQNDMTQVPPISGLTQLEGLHLQRNPIQEWPYSLGQLTNLDTLSARGWNLTSAAFLGYNTLAADGMTQQHQGLGWTKLKRLDLASAGIMSLPPFPMPPDRWSKMEFIWLANNKITSQALQRWPGFAEHLSKDGSADYTNPTAYGEAQYAVDPTAYRATKRKSFLCTALVGNPVCSNASEEPGRNWVSCGTQCEK